MAKPWRSLLALVVVVAAACSSSPAASTGGHGTTLSGAVIKMIDARNGWAYGSAIFRTSDGAQTFKDVTPRGLAPHAELDRPVFLDADHAFVFAITWNGSNLATSTLERTADGGATWQATATNPAVVGDLTFADAQRGWLLTTQNSTDHLNNTDTLWRTVDGGAGWSAVFHYTYRLDFYPSSVPGGCHWQGSIAWTSSTHGMVGVACPFDAAPSIDVTDDAGATWTRQFLPPLPDRTGTVLFSIVDSVRVFAGGRATALVSRCAGTDGTGCIPHFAQYRSSNGGRTWTGGEVFRGGTNPLVSIDPVHSWTVGCIDEDCSTVGLLASSDGGLHWSLYPIRPELGPNMHGSQIYSFVTADLGVVTVTNAMAASRGSYSKYYRTTDGGETFSQFTPRVVS